jgi:hypothetical protein
VKHCNFSPILKPKTAKSCQAITNNEYTKMTGKEGENSKLQMIRNGRYKLDSRGRDLPQLTKLFGPVVFNEIEHKLKE